MAGMMGLRRLSRCLKEALEDVEAVEGQLEIDELEQAGVGVVTETSLSGTLVRWARLDGLG